MVCHQCGQQIRTGDTFCGSCGAALSAASVPSDQAVEHTAIEPTDPPPVEMFPPPVDTASLEARARRNKRVLVIVGVGVATVLSIVFAALALQKQKERSSAIAFVVVALIAAAVPFVVAARAKSGVFRMARIPLVVVLMATLGFSSFQVAVLTCTERLGPGADLQGCDFAGEDLSTVDLSQSDLRDANLKGATVGEMRSANLEGADLSGARATGAAFDDANLKSANLNGAELTNATFGRAKLDGATLEGAAMGGVDLSGASLAGADLDNATLTSARMEGADLQSAHLEKATLTQAKLDRAVLEKAVLKDASLAGASLAAARLTEAVLDGADFRNANLEDANLERASMNGTDFTSARLSRARFGGATLRDIKLDGASMLGVTGLGDGTFAAGVGVKRVDLASYTTRHDIRLEERLAILSRLGAVCRGGVVRQASARQGKFHPLVLLDGRGRSTDWTGDIPQDWEPMAVRFGQLVACVEQSETVVQRCPYRSVTTGLPGQLTRYRNRTRIRVRAANTGATVFDRTFEGSTPDSCPQFTTFQSNGRIEGSDVDFSAVRSLLARLVR